MSRHIKLVADEKKILDAVKAYNAVTYHHSFILSKQVERENGDGKLASGSYIKVGGFKVHEPLFKEILDFNGIQLSRQSNISYRSGKEFHVRFIKSRFGETYVSFAVGGGKVLSSDSDQAKCFYENSVSESINKISEKVRAGDLDGAKKTKKDLKSAGLF